MQRVETGQRHGTVVLLAIALTSCVSVVGPPPLNESEPMTTQPSKRIPLEAEGKVVILVTTEVEGKGSSRAAHTFLLNWMKPISSPDAVVRSFCEGFCSTRSDVQVIVADEGFRKACFAPGIKLLEPTGVVLILPQLDAPDCRAAVRHGDISQVIVVGGRHQRWGRTLGWTDYYTHEFRLVARALDAKRGEAVCEAVEVLTTKSEFSLPLLIPVGNALDEQAFWARVAHDAGAKIGACFMKP